MSKHRIKFIAGLISAVLTFTALSHFVGHRYTHHGCCHTEQCYHQQKGDKN